MIQYDYLLVCPETQRQLSTDQHMYSGGVCPHCGHSKPGSITHSEKIVGWWEHPSLFHRLLGVRSKFHRKTT